MRIVCIDPGTSNTGLVYMDEREIFCSKTITHKDRLFKDQLTKAGKPSREVDQTKLLYRARSIYIAIRDFLLANPHEAVVIEGFQTFSGSARTNAYTFQTPYLCGYLEKALEDENVIIQTSTDVLKGIDPREVVRAFPGGLGCTSEHTRAAACHGLYYLSHTRRRSNDG